MSSTVAKVIFIVVVLAIAGYIVYAVRHNKKRKSTGASTPTGIIEKEALLR